MAKDSDFIWTANHTKAFESSKEAILSCATLASYNDEKPCAIQVDTSNISVGAALIQEGNVIEYHIEREAYALVNGVEHFITMSLVNPLKSILIISHWCS